MSKGAGFAVGSDELGFEYRSVLPQEMRCGNLCGRTRVCCPCVDGRIQRQSAELSGCGHFDGFRKISSAGGDLQDGPCGAGDQSQVIPERHVSDVDHVQGQFDGEQFSDIGSFGIAVINKLFTVGIEVNAAGARESWQDG